MMRLNIPEKDFSETLDECINGITGNNNFKQKMIGAKQELLVAGDLYLTRGNFGDLYQTLPIPVEDDDPVVIGVLVKSELINLYEYYFCNIKKQSRVTYDRLLNSAQEQCPFCGGIGTPRNLDHFLPKSHFPQFSIFPLNLVPSCRDCNMDGKSVNFATQAEDQILQPYVDHERFFNVKWISARCVVAMHNMPISIQYYVDPPQEWLKSHKDRVQKHFDDFDLAKRFSVKAAQLLGTTLGQIKAMKDSNVSSEVIQNILIKPGIDNAPFINHWQRGMYQALNDYLL